MDDLSIKVTDSFARDYKRLSLDVQSEVDRCIEDLLVSPIPGARRAHSVTPKGKKPNIFTADVTSNKAYKLSFHWKGSALYLRRVGTHQRIDRSA